MFATTQRHDQEKKERADGIVLAFLQGRKSNDCFRFLN